MTDTSDAHAALMDQVYRRQRHFYDLTRHTISSAATR